MYLGVKMHFNIPLIDIYSQFCLVFDPSFLHDSIISLFLHRRFYGVNPLIGWY